MGTLLRRLAPRALSLCLVFLASLGCGDPRAEPPGATLAEAPPRDAPLLPVSASALHALGLGADGLALFDASSGAVLDEAPTLGLDGPRDVALASAGDRVLVVESDLDEGSSELAEYPLSEAPDLGERASWGPVDGEVRVLSTPFGTLLFERSYGERVRLVGGAPGAIDRRALPCPTSLTSERSAEGLVLRWLAPEAGAPTRLVRLRVDEAGLAEPETRELPEVGPSARLAGPWLADLQGEQLVLRRFEGAELGPARSFELKASRVEHFLQLDERTFAALLSGPSAVALLSLGDDGRPAHAARLPLSGRVAVADVFFSRDLVALAPDLLLVATDQGAMVLGVGADALWVERELRGVSGPFAALRR